MKRGEIHICPQGQGRKVKYVTECGNCEIERRTKRCIATKNYQEQGG